MSPLDWKPTATQPRKKESSSEANDPWMGIALGLLGVVIGYGISLLHIL